MAHLAVVQAVEARLSAGFTACPVLVENDGDGIPTNAGPFLALQFPWCRSEWQTTDGDFLEEGAFRFVLSVPRGDGTHQGRAWMDEIATLFRAVEFDGVQTYAPGSPVTDDRSEAENYYRLSISVPYEFIIEDRGA